MIRIIIFSILLLFGITNTNSRLPNIGDGAGYLLTNAEAQQLGIKILGQISNDTPIIYDSLWGFYLNRLGKNLINQSQHPSMNINFLLLKSSNINAFALPGGIVGINSELILRTDGEGELAGVLAHEISHITQNHFRRLLEKYRSSLFSSMAGLIVAAAIAFANPNLGDAALATTVAGHQQKLIGYTREHEYEADRVGTKVLSNGGYPSTAMASFFAKLPHGRYHQEIFAPLLTHPLPIERSADALNRYKPTPKISKKQKLEFQLMQIRLKTIISSNKPQLLQELKKDNLVNPRLQYEYGIALAYFYTNKKNQAIKILLELYEKEPQSLAIGYATINALIKNNKLPKAQDILSQLAVTHLDIYPLLYFQVDIYMQKKLFSQAHKVLLDIIEENPKQTKAYQLLAILATKQGNTGLVHYYLANYYYYNAELSKAIIQLELASQQIKTNNFYIKQIKSKESLWKQ